MGRWKQRNLAVEEWKGYGFVGVGLEAAEFAVGKREGYGFVGAMLEASEFAVEEREGCGFVGVASESRGVWIGNGRSTGMVRICNLAVLVNWEAVGATKAAVEGAIL